jgi:N-methylhydantoinase A
MAHSAIEAPQSTYAVGVDIGGTFTDCVALASDGRVFRAKVPTNPRERASSFFGAIDRVAEEIGLTTETLLTRSDRLIHGTTTGTNAIVAREGARVALVTTSGHRDVMYLMKAGGRTAGLSPEVLLDVPRTAKPEPLVPRRLIAEVPERVDLDGDVVVDLDEVETRRVVRQLVDDGAESIAVSLLWSIKNPSAEHRVRDIVKEIAPGAYVCCGSDLSSRVGEYERTAVSVMNAYIGPLMTAYIDAIESGVRSRGYGGRVLYMQCAGGAITGDEARSVPIRTLQSGPVGGIVGCAFLAERMGCHDVIAADMGGTTFDVSVLRDGLPLNKDLAMFARYELALPMLDVESIGAGGGSIAWIDESGRLQVGPRSAGAEPGPVCYGKGGSEPTVTDADVVLGVIDPNAFYGGEMRLDKARAEAAVKSLADRLGLDLYETAAGINRIVDAKMSDLIRRMSVLRGFDPRDFVCFAFGGGGPVHAGAVAREIGLKQVVVPLLDVAPVWSALGAATADVTHVYQDPRSLDMPASGGDLTETFERLEAKARGALAEEGFSSDEMRLRRSIRMKHVAQIHDVEVPIKDGVINEADVETIDTDFTRIYEERYGKGAGYRQAGVHITGFAVRASGLTYKPSLAEVSSNGESHVRRFSRQVFWDEFRAFRETPVVAMATGALAEDLVGPALIELPHTVVVVRPGQTARSDKFGNVVLELGAAAS